MDPDNYMHRNTQRRSFSGWAGKIRQWDLDAYLYFDNDFDGFAVKNAERLREILSVTYKKFSIKNRQFSRMPPGIEEFSYDTEDRDQRSGNYG